MCLKTGENDRAKTDFEIVTTTKEFAEESIVERTLAISQDNKIKKRNYYATSPVVLSLRSGVCHRTHSMPFW